MPPTGWASLTSTVALPLVFSLSSLLPPDRAITNAPTPTTRASASSTTRCLPLTTASAIRRRLRAGSDRWRPRAGAHAGARRAGDEDVWRRRDERGRRARDGREKAAEAGCGAGLEALADAQRGGDAQAGQDGE